jgi:hypothetical protein
MSPCTITKFMCHLFMLQNTRAAKPRFSGTDALSMHAQRSHEDRNFEEPSWIDSPELAQSGVHDIYVRAHTPVKVKKPWNRPRSSKWPKYCLVFDTETTIDPKQKLTFGCYRRCQREAGGYRCIEEGLFYADDLPERDVKVLEKYAKRQKKCR